MPWSRPGLSELVRRGMQDLRSRIDEDDSADPFLRRSFEAALVRAMAGFIHGLYGHQAWIAKQAVPSLLSDPDTILRWARLCLEVPRVAATRASGQATFTGTDGAVLPEGTVVRIGEVTYEVASDATISAGDVVAELVAVVAGVAGNASEGSRVTVTTPIAGVDSSGTVGPGDIEGGADEEAVASIFDRLALRLSQPPLGGGPGDYVRWAREVAGVTRAWEYAHADGIGTVAVTFMRDTDVGTGIPSAPEVAEVQAYIDSKAPIDIRPYIATKRVHVFAPTPNAVDMTIALSPNTVATRENVTSALADLFRREAAPNSPTPFESRIGEAISTAPGEERHEILAITSLTPPDGGLNVLGTITFEAL